MRLEQCPGHQCHRVPIELFLLKQNSVVVRVILRLRFRVGLDVQIRRPISSHLCGGGDGVLAVDTVEVLHINYLVEHV